MRVLKLHVLRNYVESMNLGRFLILQRLAVVTLRLLLDILNHISDAQMHFNIGMPDILQYLNFLQ